LARALLPERTRTATYVYRAVPPAVYYRMKLAESKGRYFNQEIARTFEYETRYD